MLMMIMSIILSRLSDRSAENIEENSDRDVNLCLLVFSTPTRDFVI